jgi:hypothetical protein
MDVIYKCWVVNAFPPRDTNNTIRFTVIYLPVSLRNIEPAGLCRVYHAFIYAHEATVPTFLMRPQVSEPYGNAMNNRTSCFKESRCNYHVYDAVDAQAIYMHLMGVHGNDPCFGQGIGYQEYHRFDVM